jgi:valyl-tRNA synthetase
MVRDEDIFDTWFSSCQWPFTSLGGLETQDFKTFYPTSVLETGRDILLFWVARMVIMGIYKTGESPFSDVYIHGLVLDKEGRKQSKSKGNGIEPKDLISKFGRDALRLSLVAANAPDQDFRLYDEKVMGSRNFINKVYNSARLIFLKLEDLNADDKKFIREHSGTFYKKTNMPIHPELTDIINSTTRNMNNFQFGKAAFNLREFYHHTYCDLYLEDMKQYNDIEAKCELVYTLYILIKLMHPFIPFITENIYQELIQRDLIESDDKSIMYTEFPK